MANDFGIKLAVSVGDLLDSVNRALDGVNKSPELTKLKVGIDTSAWDNAIKKLKSDLSSISVKVDTSKIGIGGSAGIDGKSLKSAVKSQTSELDTFVAGYMKQFQIIKKNADYTAEEIRAKFTSALSAVLDAQKSGDNGAIEETFRELINLTDTFSKKISDDSAVNALEDFKASLGGVVPISRDVQKELEYLCGSRKKMYETLVGAFGRDGFEYTDGINGAGTDVFLSNLGLPGYDEMEHAANGLLRLAEAASEIRSTAMEKHSLLDMGAYNSDDIINWVKNFETLNNIREQQNKTANDSAQAEKQAAVSLQSVAEVTEKLKMTMTPEIGDGAGDYASKMMASIEPYANAVDALGRALDRLSASKTVDMRSELSALNDSLNIFKEGISSPQGLVNELNLFAAAEEKTVNAVNAENKALGSLAEQIDKVNKKRNEGNKSANGIGKTQNIGVGVKANELIKSINTAIRDINKDSSDSLTKVKLSANTVSLRSSLRNAVSEINKSGSLDSAPVKLSIAFKNVKAAIAELQKQLNGSTVNIGNLVAKGTNVGATVGNNARSAAADVTEELKKQAAAQTNVGNAAGESAKSVVNAANSENKAVSSVSEAIEGIIDKIDRLNRVMKVTETISAGGTPISKTVKSGTDVSNITDRFGWDAKHGEWSLSNSTSEYNASTLKSNLEKTLVTVIQLNSELQKAKAAYSDLNAPKPIKETEHIDELNEKYKEIERTIIKMSQSGGAQTAVMKADISAQIAELDRLTESFRNAEYAATSLRARDIGTVKAEEVNRLDGFISKITGSKVPISEMQTDVDSLKASLEKVFDKETLTAYLNQFSIAESKFKALTEGVKASENVFRQLENGIKSLDKILNNKSLGKIGGNDKSDTDAVIRSAADIKNQYLALQNSLKSDGSAENLAKIKEKAAELDEQLVKLANTAETLSKRAAAGKDVDAINKKIAQTRALITRLQSSNAVAMNKANTASGSGLTFGEELRQLNEQLQQSPQLVDGINAKVRTLEAQMKQLGYTGNTVLGDLKEKALKFVKWTGMTLLITKARMYFRKLFSTVYELDTALVDLRKTFTGTDEELNQFYYDANKLAKQLGVTTKEIIEQGAAFSRLGYSSKEAMETMAQMSSMFAAISPDMDTSTATDGLVSIMKAFDIDPDNVLDGILSKVNIIGNTAATSNGEIVEMLEKSSSAMKEANNILEETIALETAAVEITRDSASVGMYCANRAVMYA